MVNARQLLDWLSSQHDSKAYAERIHGVGKWKVVIGDSVYEGIGLKDAIKTAKESEDNKEDK